MGKKISAFLMAFFGFAITMFGQATSLDIDNQTPGWLSSKINYGDQQTLKKLRITGYINGLDVDFLRSLSKDRSLRILDLENANLIAYGDTKNRNTYSADSIITYQLFKNYSLQKLVLPRSLKIIDDGFEGATIDSLILAECQFETLTYGLNANYIFLPEGLKVIATSANYFRASGFKISIPSTITKIDYYPFRSTNTIVYSHITDPENVDGVYYVYSSNGGTRYYLQGTIYVPKGTKEKYEHSDFSKMTIIEWYDVDSVATKAKSSLYVGEEDQIETVIYPDANLTNGIIYSSSDPSIATVTESGLVTAVEAGEVDIYVTPSVFLDVESKTDTIHYKVLAPTTGITISQTSAKVHIGESIKLDGNTLPLGVSDGLMTWSSENQDIATVDSDGTVYGHSKGTTYVTATTKDGLYSAQCEIKVLQPVTQISLTLRDVEIKVGEQKALRIEINPSDADDKTISWRTGDDSIVSVSDMGEIQGLHSGKTFVYAISNDNPNAKDSCFVTVLQPVIGLVLTPEALVFSEIGVTQQIVATVLPEDASNKNVNWTSSNNAVCMVSPNGEVVSTGNGNAIIMASTADGGFMALCNVMVDNVDYVGNFRLTHAAILSKTIDTVTPDDLAAIEAALADYEQLPESAKEALAAEKALLDALKAKVEEILSGISSVYTGGNANNHLYNIAGQAVNDSFRGIVIINGRKVYMK